MRAFVRGGSIVLLAAGAATAAACTAVLGVSDYQNVDCVGAACGDAGDDATDGADTTDAPPAIDGSDSSGDDGSTEAGDDAADANDATDTAPEACTADTGSDPLHCGSCGTVCTAPKGATPTCVAGACGFTIDVGATALWKRASTPGPYLAFFRDGKLLASANDTTARLYDTSQADPTSVPFPNAGGRPTVVIPSDTTKPTVAVSHYGSFVGYAEDGTQAWNNGIHGCCGSGPAGFAIDPIQRRLFAGHDITELNTDDGTTVVFDAIYSDGDGFYVSGGSLYSFYGGTGTMVRWARSDFSKTYSYAVPTTGPTPDSLDHCALSADETFVCAIPNIGKLVAVKKAGTLGWSIDLPGGGMPVITGDGLVVVGAKASDGTTTLQARKLADGTSAWSISTADEVADVLVGDDGVLYVAVKNVSGVVGLDRDTGVARYQFDNVGYPLEMVLRGGVMYAFASAQLVAFQVPAMGYDKTSPWPVRYHDNQRSRSLLMPLDY